MICAILRVLFRTADYHMAGEPLRIVADGVPQTGEQQLPSDIRAQESSEVDAYRTLLYREPLGHATCTGFCGDD